MAIRATAIVAITLMALALVPSGAHFFERFNKMALDREAYFTVQQIYAGWALFGFVLFAALFADIGLAITLRRQRLAASLAGIGALSLVVSLAIFFTWIFPANQATANWTDMPADWQELRWQWETAHAVDAVITFVGFVSVALSAIMAERA